MSPATIANPAWPTVPSAQDLPEKVGTEIGPVAQKIGFVPNVARLATATGLFPNPEYHELGRAPAREG